jgi:hypothetical protein
MKKWDGFDEAIIGQALVFSEKGRTPVLVYSGAWMVDILCSRDGMTPDEAQEYIEFNIEGAYIGADTPIIVWTEFDCED